MRKPLFRILLWLAVMAILTLLAMGLWLITGGNNQSTESLKWLQFLQTLGTFALPPILCAWLWNNHQPFSWLKLNRPLPWQTALWAIGLMICALPAINLLADLNSRIELPKSLDFIEQILKQQEEAAAALTERFLQADNFGMLLINVCLMAFLPALSEELSFRGTLQQILSNDQHPKTKSHIAIWVTAFIFSAIHMQFYGFIPRMLLGAMFGYVFLWTGNLWAPILMHFTNNALAVIAYYLTTNDQNPTTNNNWADTFGAGSTWWVGVLSLLITSLGLLIFVRRTRKE